MPNSLAGRSEADPPIELKPVSESQLVAGRYRLLATLGRGGMADVYLGAATGPAGFNKLVVVKRLRAGASEDASLVQMFLDEARLAARLNHPNIVHTYEVEESADGYLLVMEYLEGQSLRRFAKALRARDQRIDPILAAYLVAETLEGLHYVHEMRDYDGSPLGVVHRDVSPQNLFVTYDGVVKVLDFGIAKGALNVTDTQSGVLKGKVSYMAPEQASEGAVDRRADIFSVGVVLWELLTGDKLFKGDTIATLHSLASSRIDPPSSRVPGISPTLDGIVLKALARSVDARYPSAQAMHKALAELVRRSGRIIGREDVAARMQECFADARETMAKRVQAYMASKPPPSSRPSEITTPSLPAAAVSGVRPSVKRKMALGAWLALGGALVTAAAGAVAFWAVRSRHVPQATTAAILAPAGETTKDAPAVARADSESTFHLTLGSDPPEAQVEWGGNMVGQTPMLIDLAPGPQTFVISKDGFFKATVVLSVSESMAGRNESRTVVLVPRQKSRAGTVAGGRGAAAKNASANSAIAAPIVAQVVPSPAPVPNADPAPLAVAPPAPAPTPAAKAGGAPEPTNAPPPSPSPAAAPTVLPFGPEMTRPVLISGGDLVYPREAMIAGVSGTMIAKCTITTEGTVRSCRIIKGLPFLDKPMLDALATQRYSPVVYQGKPVSVEYVFNRKVSPPANR